MDPRQSLYSSPSRKSMQAEALIILSSSPEFPSIDELLPGRDKNSPLRSGSRAAPIPETALKSLTTASHFWQSTIVDDHETAENGGQAITREGQGKATEVVDQPVPLPVAAENAETIVARKLPVSGAVSTAGSLVPVERKKRAPGTRRPKAAVSDEAAQGLDVLPQDKRPRKAKERNADDKQSKIAQGKVTKLGVDQPKKSRKKADTVSKHFTTAPVPEAVGIDGDLLDLEPALKRRTDWTPTKNTENSVILLDSSTVKDSACPVPGGLDSSLEPPQYIFKSLRDTYSCPDVEDKERASIPPQEPTDVLGKRKLIEMVATGRTVGAKTPEVSPVKQKAPKKKPRTITELATSAYRVDPVVADLGTKESLRNYFTPDEESEVVTPVTDKAAAVPAKGTKPGPKTKPKRPPKKKAAPPQPILLSPESALKQVLRQDFVFGTSSQLATEVDAGLLRDLQQAMRDSNRREELNPLSSSPANSHIASKSSGSKLWRAGARDEDGDLLEVEVIDLVDSPAIEKDLTNPAVILSLAPDVADANPMKLGVPPNPASVISLSSPPARTHSTARLSFTQALTPPVSTSFGIAGKSSTAPTVRASLIRAIELDDDPPASNQEQYQQMASSISEAPPASAEPPAPKYELYTDAQLAKEVQSYGFKAVKRRTAAIALLQQCWTSKHQNQTRVLGQNSTASISTSSTGATNAKATASGAASPKPRGRPRKGASATEGKPVEAVQPTKRPRGRPKKDSVMSETTVSAKSSKSMSMRTTLSPPPVEVRPSTPIRKGKAPVKCIVEIADSDQDEPDDDDPIASSSAGSSPAPANEFSSPVAGVDLSMTTDVDESALSLTSSPTNQQARLFKYITDAVKTAPRSTDPENPSWHEKMLLYDPVVLEDLTAWLNGGQLDRVGCEDEVSCQDVKKWCESKSVCCLWKVNINGKERKRF